MTSLSICRSLLHTQRANQDNTHAQTHTQTHTLFRTGLLHNMCVCVCVCVLRHSPTTSSTSTTTTTTSSSSSSCVCSSHSWCSCWWCSQVPSPTHHTTQSCSGTLHLTTTSPSHQHLPSFINLQLPLQCNFAVLVTIKHIIMFYSASRLLLFVFFLLSMRLSEEHLYEHLMARRQRCICIPLCLQSANLSSLKLPRRQHQGECRAVGGQGRAGV